MADEATALDPAKLAGESTEPRRCADCGVYTHNAEHICLEYDDSHPCEECGAATVFCFAGAPGTGTCRYCRSGHYTENTMRELTLAEVI